jgi:hypothetical protein
MREFRVSQGAFFLSVLGLALFVGMAVLFMVGLWQGSGWLPGGSVLERENERLSTQIGRLEERIALLRAEMAEVYRLQEMVSLAVDLDPIDPNVWEAGVGGRGPHFLPATAAVPERDLMRLGSLEQELAKLLRQARIQHQGYRSILDTLASRAAVRDFVPTIRPLDTGWVSSGFGKRKDPFTGKLTFHHGLDFSVPVGTPVRATADGLVTTVKHEKGFGRLIRIDHGGQVTTVYAHLSKTFVQRGQRVRRGEIIGESGRSGRVTAPHLHYEVRLGKRRVNPLPFILDSYATR